MFVSGTTARPPDLQGDAYAQTKAALAIIATALGEVGAQLSSVVRTVVLVQQRYAKSHRILANCRGVKDFRRFRNSQKEMAQIPGHVAKLRR